MSTIRLTGDYEFSIERADTEAGEIMFTCEVGNDSVIFEVGQDISDADALLGVLSDLTSEVQKMINAWQYRPDSENDGFISQGRNGYFATLYGKSSPENHNGYPTQDIAAYELARLMADSQTTPNAWYQGERGIDRMINTEVHAYLDDNDGLKPLPNAKYASGTNVIMDHPNWDWRHFVVDQDYGDLGVMVHTSGDPSMTELATHEQLKPYPDDDESEADND